MAPGKWLIWRQSSPSTIGRGEPASGGTKDPLLTPLGLSESEQADLVEFLKTLSGEPVPSALLTAP